MRRFLLFGALLFLAGCASVNVPGYIQDKHPYKENLYASFEQVVTASTDSLRELGWSIEKSTDPSVFEHAQYIEVPDGKQILLFTDIRQTSLIIGSRYARVNVYIRTGSGSTTEIELRYLVANSLPFKTFYSYKNDSAIDRIMKRIKEKLG